MTGPSDAAVEKAAEALYRELYGPDPVPWLERGSGFQSEFRDCTTVALSAALPIIREELAQEIEARATEVWGPMGGSGFHTYLDAARIVRGEGA